MTMVLIGVARVCVCATESVGWLVGWLVVLVMDECAITGIQRVRMCGIVERDEIRDLVVHSLGSVQIAHHEPFAVPSSFHH